MRDRLARCILSGGTALVLVLIINPFGPRFLTADRHELVLLLPSLALAAALHAAAHVAAADLFGIALPRRRLGLGPRAADPDRRSLSRFDRAHLSLAGPTTNLLAATASLVALTVAERYMDLRIQLPARAFVEANVVLAVFSLLPLPPLCGFELVLSLSPRPIQDVLWKLRRYGAGVLLALSFAPWLLPGFPPVLALAIDVSRDFILDVLGALYRAV